MQVPMEISFRGVRRTAELDRLIQKKAAHLDKVCKTLISCRLAVEQPQAHQQNGNPYRVRLDLRVPPGHELVVRSKPREHPMHEDLHAVVTETFDAAERQLRKLVEQMHGRVKAHPDQQTGAFVTRIFRDQGYGFIRGLDGTDYYFHRNSVLHNGFDRLDVGTGVSFVAETGQEGPQASTVEIVDKPGGHGG